MSITHALHKLTRPLVSGRESGMSLLSLMVGVGITGIVVVVVAAHSSNLTTALNAVQKDRDSEHFMQTAQKHLSNRESLDYSLTFDPIFECYQEGTSPCVTSTDRPFNLFDAKKMKVFLAGETMMDCVNIIRNGTIPVPGLENCTVSNALIPATGVYLTRAGKKTISTDPTAVWFIFSSSVGYCEIRGRR